jgi:hypothetical protein
MGTGLRRPDASGSPIPSSAFHARHPALSSPIKSHGRGEQIDSIPPPRRDGSPPPLQALIPGSAVMMRTVSAPRRMAVLAASIATFPAPNTATFSLYYGLSYSGKDTPS